MKKEVLKQPYTDEQLINRAFDEHLGEGINYSETGAKLLFSYKLRKSIDKLNNSTTWLSILAIFIAMLSLLYSIYWKK